MKSSKRIYRRKKSESSIRLARMIIACFTCTSKKRLKKILPEDLKDKKHPLRKLKKLVDKLGLTFFSTYWKFVDFILRRKRMKVYNEEILEEESKSKKNKTSKKKKKSKKKNKALTFKYSTQKRIHKRGTNPVCDCINRAIAIADSLNIKNPMEG